jgi:chromosomal replication initiator protein
MDRPDGLSVALPVDSVSILSAQRPPADSAVGPSSHAPIGAWFAFERRSTIVQGLASASSLEAFSPLTIYGPRGCGKSTLARVLSEIDARRFESRPRSGQRLVVTKLSVFDKQVRHAALVGGLDDLLDQWHSCSCWLVEDYHQFAGSPFADQLFVRTLSERQSRRQLTILTGETAPWAFAAFSPRLRSRLTAGLVIGLERPAPSVVRRVAQWTAGALGLAWHTEALDLASKSNISLSVLVDYLRQLATRKNRPATVDTELIRPLLVFDGRQLSRGSKLILSTVARHFRLKLPELVGSSRRQGLVRARGVAICLLRDLLQLKWQKIAELTGRSDHSTVLHAYGKTHRQFASDPLLADAYRALQQQLASRLSNAGRLAGDNLAI